MKFSNFYFAIRGISNFLPLLLLKNVQFPSRVSIHLSTRSIDRQVSSTRSFFHRSSFNQKGRISRILDSSSQTNFNPTLPRRCIEEKLIDFRGRSRLRRSGTILEKRKFASELNPWLCHASYVSFFSFLVPKNFLSPPPLPLPLPSRMVGCWGHRRRPSRAII